MAGEASLSSELSGAGEAICTDGGGLSQGGLVLWSVEAKGPRQMEMGRKSLPGSVGR